MRLSAFVSTVMIAALVSTVSAADTKYSLTGENTTIEFVGTKKDGKHTGGFKTLTGNATMSGEDLATLKIGIEIDLNSTYSDSDKLTTHLKSPDFFGVKANPKSKFVAKVTKKGEEYTVTGELTLNGKKAAVSFPATLAVEKGELTLSASFKINRQDWGIKYGKGMVDDEVAMTVKIKASKKE